MRLVGPQVDSPAEGAASRDLGSSSTAPSCARLHPVDALVLHPHFQTWLRLQVARSHECGSLLLRHLGDNAVKLPLLCRRAVLLAEHAGTEGVMPLQQYLQRGFEFKTTESCASLFA